MQWTFIIPYISNTLYKSNLFLSSIEGGKAWSLTPTTSPIDKLVRLVFISLGQKRSHI